MLMTHKKHKNKGDKGRTATTSSHNASPPRHRHHNLDLSSGGCGRRRPTLKLGSMSSSTRRWAQEAPADDGTGTVALPAASAPEGAAPRVLSVFRSLFGQAGEAGVDPDAADDASARLTALVALVRTKTVEARATIGKYRSVNKRNVEKEKQREQQDSLAYNTWKLEKQRVVDALKKRAPKQGASMKEILKYGAAVARSEVGNCYELSALACKLLYEAGLPLESMDLVGLASPGDHAFLVLNQPKGPDGSYPDDFAQWSDDAIICDPWANIVCLAQNYPGAWQVTMATWKMRGKTLPAPRDGERVGAFDWLEPTHPFWLSALISNAKKSYTSPGKGHS